MLYRLALLPPIGQHCLSEPSMVELCQTARYPLKFLPPPFFTPPSTYLVPPDKRRIRIRQLSASSLLSLRSTYADDTTAAAVQEPGQNFNAEPLSRLSVQMCSRRAILARHLTRPARGRQRCILGHPHTSQADLFSHTRTFVASSQRWTCACDRLPFHRVKFMPAALTKPKRLLGRCLFCGPRRWGFISPLDGVGTSYLIRCFIRGWNVAPSNCLRAGPNEENIDSHRQRRAKKGRKTKKPNQVLSESPATCLHSLCNQCDSEENITDRKCWSLFRWFQVKRFLLLKTCYSEIHPQSSTFVMNDVASWIPLYWFICVFDWELQCR